MTTNPTRFRLELNMRVHNIGADGYGREGLTIADEINLGELGFMEIAKVLGQFHDLAEAIRKERDK